MTEISEKSKKNEILDAYYELLQKVQDTKEVSHQDTQRKQQESELVFKEQQVQSDLNEKSIKNHRM